MSCSRVVAVSLGGLLLSGCFSEPGAGGGATGATAASSSTAAGASTGEDPGSTSTSTTDATAVETTSSTATSSGSTESSSSSGQTTSSGTTLSDTSTGGTTLQCADGFAGLGGLFLDEVEMVTFAAPVPYAPVTMVVEQAGNLSSFEYVSEEPSRPPGTTVWTFESAYSTMFVPGQATLRFAGSDGKGVPFEATCQILLE